MDRRTPSPSDRGPLAAAVRSRLRSYDGLVLTDPLPCPGCGARNYRRHDHGRRLFAALVTDDGPEEVVVRYRRYRCRGCGRTVPADRSPLFYEDCRYGRPVVDLCRRLAAAADPGTAADRLRRLGVRVDADTVRRYVSLFDDPDRGFDPLPDPDAGPDEVADDGLAGAVVATLFPDAPRPASGDGDERPVPDRSSPAHGTAIGGRGEAPTGVERPGRPGLPVAAGPDDDAGSAAVSDPTVGALAAAAGEAAGVGGLLDAWADAAGQGAPGPWSRDAGARGDVSPDGDRPVDWTADGVPPLVRALLAYRAVLAELTDGPRSTADLTDAVAPSRSTVCRVLSTFRSAGLATRCDGDHAATPAGRLALACVRRLLGADRSPSTGELLVRRDDVLAALVAAPAHKRDLVERLPCSRSTVDRAVAALADAALVERRPDGYAATAAGRRALAAYCRFAVVLERVLAAADVLASVSREHALPLSAFADAPVAVGGGRHRLFEVLADRLPSADRYRAVLPRIADSRHLRLLHEQAVGGGLDATLVCADAVAERLRAEFPHVASELATTNVGVHAGPTPSFGVVLLAERDRDDGAPVTAVVVTYDDGDVGGVLVSEAESAVAWAAGRLARAAADARPVEGLRSAPAGAAVAPLTGERLPARLRDQGFERVDERTLDERSPLPPAAAWRAGLGLAEVAAGYAVPRHRDGDPLAATLRERLADGGAVALLGPPGTGKSTVCRRVACEWAGATGPVVYRAGGRGRPFDATGALAAVLDRCCRPVLVVVEEATRPGARAVFDFLERVRGRDDVAVLLDARESAWRDPVGPADARDAALRRVAVETVHVPPLAEADCRRLVDRAASLTGEPPGVRPSTILDAVRDRTDERAAETATDVPAAGEMALATRRLAHHLDPLADDEPTVVDDHAADVYASLADLGDAALAVGVLANALNAAGMPVEPAYLHAVAAGTDRAAGVGGAGHVGAADGGGEPRFGAVRAALDCLEGAVLFPADGERPYRTVHGTWSVAFLATLLESEGPAAARRRFGRCLGRLLALADDPAVRDRVAGAVDRQDPVTAAAATPAAWTERTAERLFALGRDRPRLSPLFDAGGEPSVPLPAAAPDDLDERVQVWLGRMLTAAGDYDAAERAFRRLSTVPAFAAERALGLSEAAHGRGDYDAAVEHGRACLPRARERGDRRVAARARMALGRVARARADYETAREHFRESRDAFERLDDRRRLATSLDGLATVARDRGRYDRAREHGRRSLDLSRELGDRAGEADARRELGIVAERQGDYDAADEQLREALSLYRALGDRAGEAGALSVLGLAARNRGDAEAARAFAERALSLREAIDDRHGRAKSYTNLAVLAWRRGDYETAAEYGRQAAEATDAIGDRHGHAKSLSVLGIVAKDRGDLGAARDHYRRALATYREVADRHGRAKTRNNLGEVARRRGDLDAAADHLRAALSLYEELDDRHGRARARDQLGTVARGRGDPGAAREQFETAAELFRAVDATDEAVAAVERCVEVCLTLDDRAAAAEWCRTGIDLAPADGGAERFREQLDSLSPD